MFMYVHMYVCVAKEARQGYCMPVSWLYIQFLTIQCGCWESKSGPLEEMQIHLTTKPSLQLLKNTYLTYNYL